MPRIDRIGLFALVVSFVFITGCGKAPGAGGSASKDERVLARINNVGLTVSDFKDDAGPLLTKKYLSHSPLKQKGQILEELITKEVMLQFALYVLFFQIITLKKSFIFKTFKFFFNFLKPFDSATINFKLLKSIV